MSLLLRNLCIVACVLAVCAKPRQDFTIQSRIAGLYTAATANQFPYMVSIRSQQVPSIPILPIPPIQEPSHICGGSVIGAKWILTAAHCLCTDYISQVLQIVKGVLPPASSAIGILASVVCKTVEPWKLTVVTGSIYLSTGGTSILVENVIQHPDYNAKAIQYDLGLIQLKSSTGITPIALSGVEPVDQRFTLCGWGLNSGISTILPDELQTAALDQLDTATCAAIIAAAVPGATVTDLNLCTDDESDPCPGDSGGPLTAVLTLSTGKIRVQVGIVSFGISQGNSVCNNGYPAVFTNVAKFCSFISSKTPTSCVT